MVPRSPGERAARDGRWSAPTAEALSPTPPAPAPRPESEPAAPRRPKSGPDHSPSRRHDWPCRGRERLRPAFRTPMAWASAYSRSEPAPGREKLPLTPEEKATLEAIDPGVRDQILTWLMLGEPILMREAKAKLAPPRPQPRYRGSSRGS